MPRIFIVLSAFHLLNIVKKLLHPSACCRSLPYSSQSRDILIESVMDSLFFVPGFQGKGTVKTYWLVDCARRTPHHHRRSFRRLKGPMEQSSGFLGILEPPPSPCRLSRTSSLRRTMKAIQCEAPGPKGRHVVDVYDKSDDMAQTSL